jgi:processing peptidase subunit beta
MMADCALEPRSVVAASIGQDKNAGTHKLESVTKSGE